MEVAEQLRPGEATAAREPVTVVKFSLMDQVAAELRRRYGTQQVAADAMEMHQSEISDLYRGRHDRFSVVFLIHLASKLGKKVTVTVA